MRDPLYVAAVMVMAVLVALLIACVAYQEPDGKQLRNAYYPYSVETSVRDR